MSEREQQPPEEPKTPQDLVEQLAALRASMDQALAAMGEMAKAVRRYYEELIAAGFEKDQAFTLAMAYQTTMLSSGGGDG